MIIPSKLTVPSGKKVLTCSALRAMMHLRLTEITMPKHSYNLRQQQLHITEAALAKAQSHGWFIAPVIMPGKNFFSFNFRQQQEWRVLTGG
jgi:hypothetical protein